MNIRARTLVLAHMGIRLSGSLVTAATLPVLIFSSACDMTEMKTGPMRTEPISIELGSADRANIELNFGAGQLDLKGGGDGLIAGNFKYNSEALKPVVQSSRNGSHAVVTIKQTSEKGGLGGHARSEWDLQLNSKTLLDLAVNCGAGQDNLDLRDVALRSLNVQMGAGQVDLDLRGHPTKDYEVEIAGGVGQATIHLPDGVGVRAEAHGGIGSINVTGLQKMGDHYENADYDKAKVNVRLKVEGGIGEINILGS